MGAVPGLRDSDLVLAQRSPSAPPHGLTTIYARHQARNPSRNHAGPTAIFTSPLFLAARHIAQASSSAEMRPSAPWYQTQTHHGALVCVTRLYAFLLKNQGPSCLPSFGILGDPNRTLVRAPLLAARTMRAGLPGKAHDSRTRRGPFFMEISNPRIGCATAVFAVTRIPGLSPSCLARLHNLAAKLPQAPNKHATYRGDVRPTNDAVFLQGRHVKTLFDACHTPRRT